MNKGTVKWFNNQKKALLLNSK